MRKNEERKATRITADELRDRIHYDPATGRLSWIIMPRGAKPDGEVSNIRTRHRGRHVYKYRQVRLGKVNYNASHLVWLWMTGEYPPSHLIVDHVDGDATNERWNNLRLCTHEENLQNTKATRRLINPWRPPRKAILPGTVVYDA